MKAHATKCGLSTGKDLRPPDAVSYTVSVFPMNARCVPSGDHARLPGIAETPDASTAGLYRDAASVTDGALCGRQDEATSRRRTGRAAVPDEDRRHCRNRRTIFLIEKISVGAHPRHCAAPGPRHGTVLYNIHVRNGRAMLDGTPGDAHDARAARPRTQSRALASPGSRRRGLHKLHIALSFLLIYNQPRKYTDSKQQAVGWESRSKTEGSGGHPLGGNVHCKRYHRTRRARAG